MDRLLGSKSFLQAMKDLHIVKRYRFKKQAYFLPGLLTRAKNIQQYRQIQVLPPRSDWSQDVVDAGEDWPYLTEWQQRCDAAFDELRLKSDFIPFKDDSPTLICVVRNEELRLPSFLKHYQGLGVACFHFIDNGSTDSTAAILRRAPGVTLWSTSASYRQAAYGQMWVAALARRYGLCKWIVNVDADEFLVFAGMGRRSITDLVVRVSALGFSRIATPMIDMYAGPDRFWRPLGQWSANPLLARCGWFDGRAGGLYSECHGPFGVALTGGPRKRLNLLAGGDGGPWICKVPLALWSDSTAYANPHLPYPFSETPTQRFAALLHFKFLEDFSERVDFALSIDEHWNGSSEYRTYAKWLRSGLTARLYDRRISVRYRNPGSLIAEGLIVDPWLSGATRGAEGPPCD